LQFLSRPFVAGDMVQFNGPGNLSVTGVVDKVAPMRVMLRTEDGAVVSIPNKVGGGLV
jgi:small-conductance mechanosensitive channel